MDAALRLRTVEFGLAGLVLYLPLFRLPEKVPMPGGMPLGPTMLFAFLEYQVYRAASRWLAWILIKLADLRRKPSS